MMKNQEGSMAIAIMVGLVAIGVATVSVSNSHNVLALKAKELKSLDTANKEDIATLNAMAQYKALLAGRRIGAHSIPGIYATNYFDRTPANWKSMKSSTFLKDSPFKITSEYTGTKLTASASPETDVEKALQTINGSTASPSSPSGANDSFIGTIEKIGVKATGPGAGFAVDSATLLIKKGGKVVMRGEVDLPVPKPYAAKIVFRHKGNGVWQEFTPGTNMTAGTIEFNAMGSGVVRQATLIVDGKKYTTETKVKGTGYETLVIRDGRGSRSATVHEANNFEAKDVLLFKDSVELFLNNDEDFLKPQCKMINRKDGFTVSLSLLGVEDKHGDPLSEEQAVIRMGAIVESSATVTLDDYKNKCQDRCPYVGESGGHDSHDTFMKKYEDAWRASSASVRKYGPVMPYRFYTADFLYEEAQDRLHEPFFNIRHKILCSSLEGSDPTRPKPVDIINTPSWKGHRTYFTMDKRACRAAYLTTRLECGCVAEDTQILLGDGVTEKRIDELTQEDEIWNPLLKKAVGIRYLTRGPEKIPMLTLSVGGKELKVTTQHPFPTHDGMKAANALTVGEEVMIEGSGWQAIRELTWVDAGETPPIVWNIYVEAEDGDIDAHHYVANGIVTGDLMIQQKLGK